MATTAYIKQATSRLNPAFAQQTSALNSQIPAIQQLFQVLMQSLEGQRATGNQNILEDASSRGLLRSTIPVDNQMNLGNQLLAQGAQYAAQQQQQIGDIRSKIAGIGVDRANSIYGLANTLYGQALQRQGLAQQKSFNQQQLNQTRALADRQYGLDQQALARGYY